MAFPFIKGSLVAATATEPKKPNSFDKLQKSSTNDLHIPVASVVLVLDLQGGLRRLELLNPPGPVRQVDQDDEVIILFYFVDGRSIQPEAVFLVVCDPSMGEL